MLEFLLAAGVLIGSIILAARLMHPHKSELCETTDARGERVWLPCPED